MVWHDSLEESSNSFDETLNSRCSRHDEEKKRKKEKYRANYRSIRIDHKFLRRVK